jgi:pimeloyl-ACP methyl ester carboxylesterase
MARIFKNWEDLRTDHEIDLTNHLIEAVSDLNLLLHNTKEYPCTHANKDIVTITINGVPSNKEEFQGFTFTKKVVNYFPPALEPDRSPEFYEKRIWDASLETVLREMDEIVQQNGDQVVFASHSYGSYMVTAYAKKFPQKIKGIIEFGAVPVTAYIALKQFGKDYIFGNGNLDRAHLIKNADKIF